MLDTAFVSTTRESAAEFCTRDPVFCARETARSNVQDGTHDSGESEADRGLIEAVARALRVTGHAALRDLDIEISGGIVVLWGRVSTYYQKQLAQATAQNVDGVRGVANGVEVVCCRYRVLDHGVI